ncbi:MAG: DUF6249 domain-containing protein [Myxococcota bacterium]|nr:DUF6249 domain-containing protein [Myxococcota bacterium]
MRHTGYLLHIGIFLMTALGIATVENTAYCDESDREKTLNNKEREIEKGVQEADQYLSDASESLKKAAQSAHLTTAASAADPNLQAYFEHKERMLVEKGKMGDPDTVVAVTVPTALFAMTVLIVVLPLYFRNKRRRVDAEIQKKAVEAGLQFIPELPGTPPRQTNDKRTGLLIAAIGIAGSVPLALYGYPREAVFGLAFVFLGGAYFLAGKYLAIDSK